MIELLSAASRFAAFAAAAGIIGTAVFQRWCLPADAGNSMAFQRCALPFAVLLIVVAHGGMLVAQGMSLASAVGGAPNWMDLVRSTQVGRVWTLRALVLIALMLCTVLTLSVHRWSRALGAGCAVLAALYLAFGVWGGHAAGADAAWEVVPANIAHLLAVSVWMGALPAWLMTVHAYMHAPRPAITTAQLSVALERFSRLAMGLMLVIVASGLWLADLYVENAGDLLGTRYGALILGKLSLLSLVLALAHQLRVRFLPTLRSATSPDASAALRHAGAELLAALGVLACAAWLAQTTPALHEPTPAWWLPFRWSIDATWEEEPALRLWIVAALIAALLGASGCWLLRGVTQRVIAAVALISASGVLAWALAVEAYPDTYRRSQVPYLTVSVASGRALYAEQCVGCHGAGGLGDGALAAALPKPPANLSEPHTALHTVGDMHWWLVHGIPESGMPGLGDALSEDDRWDLINFLRAFSQGFESRILRAAVVPRQAWLGSINFYIETSSGPSELKGFRELQHNVLLAFLGGEDAALRASTLAAALPELQRRRTAVLIVPLDGAALPADLPFPVLGAGAAELWFAYELLSRTAGDRGAPDALGMRWNHAEFLIDRFGYVRARWIAQDEAPGWRDPARLYPELERLNAESQLRPPPDDHIH